MALNSASIIRTLGNASRALGIEGPALKVYYRFSPLARRNHLDNIGLQALLSEILKEDSNCIDAGAHKGEITEVLTQLAPRGKHVAIEPIPHLAEQLQRDFPDVEVHNAALAEEPGTMTFYIDDTMPEHSRLGGARTPSHKIREVEIKLERIDDLVDPERRIDFIKVDVEGYELKLFEGARRTINRWKPVIAFEHGQTGADFYGDGPQDVHDLLVGEYGLRIFDIDGRGPYTREQFIAVFPEPIWFFVARP